MQKRYCKHFAITYTNKIKDILGYTIGSVGDSTAYNFVISFWLITMKKCKAK